MKTTTTKTTSQSRYICDRCGQGARYKFEHSGDLCTDCAMIAFREPGMTDEETRANIELHAIDTYH